MPHFHYKARSAGGESLEGDLEALSAEAVASQLLERGITPVQITAVRVRADLLGALREKLAGGPRVRLDDLILFCRQMYTLTKAGVPIIRALKGLTEQAQRPALARALGAVIEDLEAGRDLSVALGRRPRDFPFLLSSMVRVGENTGRLDETFLHMARDLELERETVNRVKAALRYPAFVMAAIAVAIAVVSLFVIPAFEKVFRGFGAELPWATRVLIAVSGFSVTYWPYILAALVLTVAGIRRYLGTERGRFRWDGLKLRLPLVGSIILRSTLTRFARAFATSYGAGVPLVQALNITARAVDNLFVGSRIDQMRDGIERGDTLTRSAAAVELFPPLVLQMLAVGEETGAVDTMLQDVAEFYEREVDYDLKNLTSTIEPILIVAIGIMVLILALGVFLPMWDLASVARGG